MKKLRLAVIAGGFSGEREVSLKSGDAVERCLDPDKYEVSRYDPRDGLALLLEDREKIDLAFVLLHGKYGEDGSIQGFLDLLQIPYVGSGVLASAMALNKKVAKDIYRFAGLRVIEDVCLTVHQAFSVDQILKNLGPSTVVKPVSEGSSLGVAVCHDAESLEKGLEQAFMFDEEVLVERFVRGTEVTCCVLGNDVLSTLPLVEIVPSAEYAFFDYKAKYTPGATTEICPARVSARFTEEAQSAAKRAHRALGCRVWSRTDMMIHNGDVYLLETNTIPGMTETSLVPLAAKAAGISFPQFVDRLIHLSLGVRRTFYRTP
ncbi:MAG: D-alanine--D-alanine ligase [Deltaproteobacteria bacterium]|nr:D-alanine--D-alanine ligase [Deltaproteobacteria bacterium]